MAMNDRLMQLLQPAVELLGFELVGVEYHPGATALLRVYIDHPEGITVDDCATVSHQVSGVLDVEDPIADAYTLEVSSPGVDRPLFRAADYQRFAGERVRVQLATLVAGRRRVRGVLLGVDGDDVLVLEGEERHRLPLAAIERATLDPVL